MKRNGERRSSRTPCTFFRLRKLLRRRSRKENLAPFNAPTAQVERKKLVQERRRIEAEALRQLLHLARHERVEQRGERGDRAGQRRQRRVQGGGLLGLARLLPGGPLFDEAVRGVGELDGRGGAVVQQVGVHCGAVAVRSEER